MKLIIKTLFVLMFFIPTFSQAAQIAYCPGTTTNQSEDIVLQQLVANFASKMGCNVGKNCLLKWNEKDKTEKFSIAWESQCGPVINGVHQLGDDGHGSTFVCKFKDTSKNSVCCWPLGYDYAKEFVICSDTLIKQNSRG